jgi:hypothetical protein
MIGHRIRTPWLACAGAVLALAACPTKDGTPPPQEPATASGDGGTTATWSSLPVQEGRDYPVAGSDVWVTPVMITMAHASDADGNDNHYVLMDLRVVGAGGRRTLQLISGQEIEAAGFVFRASELGFAWGETPARATLEYRRR